MPSEAAFTEGRDTGRAKNLSSWHMETGDYPAYSREMSSHYPTTRISTGGVLNFVTKSGTVLNFERRIFGLEARQPTRSEMQAERSCGRVVLVEVSLHEKNSSDSSRSVGVLCRTIGLCRGRLWNPVTVPIPCLDSFRPLWPRKPWQLRPAGSGCTPARPLPK